MEPIWSWGIDLILSLQTIDSWRLPMQLLTFTGITEFFLLILPALYWLVSRRLGARMATLLLLTIALGSLLKIAGHGPRPYWIDPRVQLLGGAESTFGLPSIHTLNAVMMWGLLAQYIGRRWSWLVAMLLILLVGLSRIYLGVHFPSDVIAGLLVGLLLFWRWARDDTAASRWFLRMTPSQQRFWAIALSIAFILLGVLVRVVTVSQWDAAADWPGQVESTTVNLFAAFSLADLITAAGVFVGMVFGLLFCTERALFTISASPLQLVGRYLIGVIGVLLLWQGLDLLFAQLAADESSLGYGLRYLRYSLIGFWIFGLAPLLFVKAQLAEHQAPF